MSAPAMLKEVTLSAVAETRERVPRQFDRSAAIIDLNRGLAPELDVVGAEREWAYHDSTALPHFCVTHPSEVGGVIKI